MIDLTIEELEDALKSLHDVRSRVETISAKVCGLPQIDLDHAKFFITRSVNFLQGQLEERT